MVPNSAPPASRPERIHINGDGNVGAPSEEEGTDELAHMAALGYSGGDADDEDPDPEGDARRARVQDADWLQLNGIDYNAELDQMALSVRFFDEVWIIDHSTVTEEAAGPAGGQLDRWGNPFAYGVGRWEDRSLIGQHNAH